MGVYGLWRLLDATGKEVPLHTLEGKVLAIDISIWIHQILQGYQDRFGNPKPNVHLIGLFFRICKLLHYKIKPVFVFDGGVPMLKKDTIALRRKLKSIAKNKAQQMRIELINNLIKHSVVKTVLNRDEENVKKYSPEKALNLQNKQDRDDMFKLPDLPSASKTESNYSDDYDSDSSVGPSPRKQTKWAGNIHNVDVTSGEFKALPADVRYEILTDLKETRKQSSWGRLHEMPEETHEFSGFQMKRLLKRRLVQTNLEAAEKEMGGKTLTLDELNKLLTEQGVNTSGQNCTYRVAADSSTRLIYISDKNSYMKSNSNDDNENTANNADEIEEPVPGTSKAVPICEDINEYEFDDQSDSDFEITDTNNSMLTIEEMSSDSESEIELNESRPLSKKYFGKNTFNPALFYMLEYSGLTEKQILTLLEQNKRKDRKRVENAPTESQQSNYFKIQDCENKDNVSHTRQIISTSKDDNKEFAGSTESTESFSTPQTELSESNTESNMNVSPVVVSNASNNEQDKSIETTVISSADSDSDDFVEIEDVPIPNVDIYDNKKDSNQGIQITFRSDQKMEDDIFADVFRTPNSELNSQVKSRNASLSDQFPDKSVNFISDRQRTFVEDKVILEEAVAQMSNDEIEDEQLPDTMNSGDIENDVATEDNNIQLEENETTVGNSVEHTINVETNSVEIRNIQQDDTSVGVAGNESWKISTLRPMDENELLSMKTRLESEQTELTANIGKLDRQGTDISQQIRIETQELLRLFGIPYIVAPMEAEAQCAFLEQIHLTDGTITDDSDIWLFGGQCVYKNFFNNNKKVLQYCSSDIEHHFKLTRNEMIRLALLVGSDYTRGLTGIGPVTALEILAAFPSEGDDLLQGLTKFCSWMTRGRVAGPGKASLRNKLRNIEIHKGFPSQAVVQAYLFPEVDESREGFTWGKLNTVVLADYTKRKFGWTKEKFDKIMSPLLKRLEEKESQKLISAYFKVQAVPKSIQVNLSKRIQKAVQKLNNPNAEEESENKDSMEGEIKKMKYNPPTKSRKKKTESISKPNLVDSPKSDVINVTVTTDKYIEEIIPQREKDKAAALKKKLNAIEVFRKSKQGLNKTKKVKRCIRKVKKEAGLSESDSSS